MAEAQTTQERILELLAKHLRGDGYSMTAGVADALRKASVVIAADIDSRANRVEVLMRHRHELLAGLHTARDERDEARAKLKECDDSTDFVQELREAEQATLANTQRLLGVAHAELAEALARITQLEREIDGRDKRIAELDAEAREIRSEAVGLRAGPEAARVGGWSTVWDLQTKHVNTWRDKAEWYWFARFTEEVGELGGALVGNHEGPVEWELSQIAAIALNWLDMRAAREARS